MNRSITITYPSIVRVKGSISVHLLNSMFEIEFQCQLQTIRIIKIASFPIGCKVLSVFIFYTPNLINILLIKKRSEESPLPSHIHFLMKEIA